MAKESIKDRERKRKRLVDRYAATREDLKSAGEWSELDKLPKNSNSIRLHNRCKITGRPKGYIRFFGISRVWFRKLASEGKIPGVTKSSW